MSTRQEIAVCSLWVVPATQFRPASDPIGLVLQGVWSRLVEALARSLASRGDHGKPAPAMACHVTKLYRVGVRRSFSGKMLKSYNRKFESAEKDTHRRFSNIGLRVFVIPTASAMRIPLRHTLFRRIATKQAEICCKVFPPASEARESRVGSSPNRPLAPRKCSHSLDYSRIVHNQQLSRYKKQEVNNTS
jgi:hypothetical protein